VVAPIDAWTIQDAEHMRLALALAERGRGRTSPNPMVGALLVSPEGVVVGAGYHERAGGPHAEIHALRAAGDRARGAALYCSLEPCSHTGRTGPCAVAVADAGVASVVVAVEDPNPLVAGGGVRYLRERGLEVRVGVRAAEARRLNEVFETTMRRRRPFVTLKIAMSLDGRIAASRGARTPLTSAEANRHAQRVRAEVDAIGIGSETLLVDDPLLTAREVWRDRPLTRVVFDGRLRTPPTARLLQTLAAGPVFVVTTAGACEADADRASALRDAGATLLLAGRHDVAGAMTALLSAGVTSLLLEGGAALHRAVWQAGVVDRVRCYVTPHTLGDDGVAWAMPADFSLGALAPVRAQPLGPDVLLEADVYRVD
jgi:diaminohydroxyphosphoribosylaminopyrimidine deaminase / 5-amino-6-(5-phosphoribosylamino)uracil reductase